MSGNKNKPGLLARLRRQLNKGDSWLTRDLTEFFSSGRFDDNTIEGLESRLLLADVGVEATTSIVESLRQSGVDPSDEHGPITALRNSLLEILLPCEQPLAIPANVRPYVIVVVGVNGSGKTTTIGKLARHLHEVQDLKVLLAAGDTFRAAAVEQLQAWGERNSVPVIAQESGADAAAVVYDALSAAKARDIDVVIADTAGRLHTQANLMEELKKICRVANKAVAGAPHEVLLVIDAGTGQNALRQAQEFNDAVGVTGLAITKLDSTAKGGILFAIARQLEIPLRFIGIGEQLEDLVAFDAKIFVRAILDD